MKAIILLISLMSLYLMGMSAGSQEPPPPTAQGQPRKVISDRSTTGNVKTKNNDNAAQDRIPKIIPKIHTDSSNATAQNAYKEKSDKDSLTAGRWWNYQSLLTLFTGLLVLCNILLWLSTKKSADAAIKSIELIKQAFIATHRPKLRVHSIYLEQLNSIPDSTNGSPPITHQVHCSIDNIGGSTATITRICMTFERLSKPLPVPSYSGHKLAKKTIACGESLTESCDVGVYIVDCSIDRGLDDLYFFGHIDYLDDIRTTRRTAFCRRYIQETKRFIKVDDEDYEYSY